MIDNYDVTVQQIIDFVKLHAPISIINRDSFLLSSIPFKSSGYTINLMIEFVAGTDIQMHRPYTLAVNIGWNDYVGDIQNTGAIMNLLKDVSDLASKVANAFSFTFYRKVNSGQSDAEEIRNKLKDVIEANFKKIAIGGKRTVLVANHNIPVGINHLQHMYRLFTLEAITADLIEIMRIK